MKDRLAFHALVALGLALLLKSCTIGRMAVFQFSDIKDYKRFPSRPLSPSETPFVFPSLPNDAGPYGMVPVLVPPGRASLDSVLEHSKTVAFLVVHKDTIRYERYFEGYAEDALVASFSMAKSYTSALIGVAIAEGHINSINDEVVEYIPELEARGWSGVTIEHVLQMTTGVKHQENYFNPFAGVAKSYYGRNLVRQVEKLDMDYAPGTRFKYLSINTQILGEILVRATGQDLTSYLQEKLWGPMAMEHDATWSLDQREGREKAFCCLNATARDFAKFGRLFLHKGKWEGEQLVPEAWVEASTKIDESLGSRTYYQYQWWLPSKDGAFAAEGHLGQFIYVHPAHDLVIVRLGKKSGGVNWYQVFKDIAAQH